MKALLDTQALLWYAQDHRKMSRTASDFIRSSENELILSVVSIWEIAIKNQLGSLPLRLPLRDFIAYFSRELALITLAITPDHALAVADLPLHHRDPFDRLLVAQAKHEGLALITGDNSLRQYDVQIIW